MTEGEAPTIEPRDSAVRTLVEVSRLALEAAQEFWDGNLGIVLARIRSLRELVNQANAEVYSVIESRIPNAEPPSEEE